MNPNQKPPSYRQEILQRKFAPFVESLSKEAGAPVLGAVLVVHWDVEIDSALVMGVESSKRVSILRNIGSRIVKIIEQWKARMVVHPMRVARKDHNDKDELP